MTIQQALAWVDEKKHNVFSRADKLFWLRRIEDTAADFMRRFEGFEQLKTADFSADADPEQMLLIPSPDDQLYLRWLECQIDYASQEYRKYNNSKTMFEAEWQAFTDRFHRSHRFRGCRMRF